jgi:hypothetical protein
VSIPLGRFSREALSQALVNKAVHAKVFHHLAEVPAPLSMN